MSIEGMEMPTPCDCGNWFDLNDGCTSHDRSKMICEDCSEVNENRKNVEGDIEERERIIESLNEEIEIVKGMIDEDKEKLENLPNYK